MLNFAEFAEVKIGLLLLRMKKVWLKNKSTCDVYGMQKGNSFCGEDERMESPLCNFS